MISDKKAILSVTYQKDRSFYDNFKGIYRKAMNRNLGNQKANPAIKTKAGNK